MSRVKTEIMNKEKCDNLMNEICNDKKFYTYLHKVMINTYEEYYGLKNVIDIDDFKGECFLKIYKSLDLFDNEKSTLKTFCIMCVKSTALQTLRSSRATKNKLLNSENLISLEAEIYDTEDCNFNDMLCGKDDEYFFGDFKSKVIEAMFKLTDRERESLILKMQGYKTIEIAKMLNISISNANNRISKARIKLKKYLNIEE